ncbi:MAG: hypothetical protein AB7N71_08355, partial [Phycisphaerae bacterium]
MDCISRVLEPVAARQTWITRVAFGAILSFAAGAFAQSDAESVKKLQQQREAAFADTLKNVDLVGSFRMTRDLAKKEPLGDPIPEKYGITSAVKDDGEWWIVTARIQYMNNDVQMPVRVRVVWADDTPVITVDDVMIPGIGKYSARVMIYRGYYCGTWFGANYGGVMSGEVRPHQEADDASENKPTETPDEKKKIGPGNAPPFDAYIATGFGAADNMVATGVGASYAVLTDSGIEVVDGARRTVVPNTRGVIDFDWDDRGNGFVIARGGELLRINTSGVETGVISRGYSKIWSVDCAPRGDRVVFAADASTATGVIWQVSEQIKSPKRAGGGTSPILDQRGERMFYLPMSTGSERVNVLHFSEKNRDALTLPASVDNNPGRHLAYADSRGALIWSNNGALTMLDGKSGSVICQLTSGAAH